MSNVAVFNGAFHIVTDGEQDGARWILDQHQVVKLLKSPEYG